MGSWWFEYKVPVEEDEKLLEILVTVVKQWEYTYYFKSVYIKMTKMGKFLLHVFTAATSSTEKQRKQKLCQELIFGELWKGTKFSI